MYSVPFLSISLVHYTPPMSHTFKRGSEAPMDIDYCFPPRKDFAFTNRAQSPFGAGGLIGSFKNQSDWLNGSSKNGLDGRNLSMKLQSDALLSLNGENKELQPRDNHEQRMHLLDINKETKGHATSYESNLAKIFKGRDLQSKEDRSTNTLSPTLHISNHSPKNITESTRQNAKSPRLKPRSRSSSAHSDLDSCSDTTIIPRKRKKTFFDTSPNSNSTHSTLWPYIICGYILLYKDISKHCHRFVQSYLFSMFWVCLYGPYEVIWWRKPKCTRKESCRKWENAQENIRRIGVSRVKGKICVASI